MSAITFYGIANNELNKVLAVLLQKSLKIQKECCIIVNTQEEAEALNKYLWSGVDWLPHCLIGEEVEQSTPVIIKPLSSTLELAKKLDYIFIMGNIEYNNISNFEKVFIIFTLQNEENMLYNQQRLEKYKKEKCLVNFYKQNEKGVFEKSI